MKTRTHTMEISVCIVALSILLFAGCSNPVSINERIDSFIEDLNTDRSHVYKNLDKDNTAQYAQAADPIFWLASFPLPDITGGSYSIAGLNDSNTLNVTGMISGPSTFGPQKTIYFMMSQDSDDNWYIQQMDFDSGFPSPIVKTVW